MNTKSIEHRLYIWIDNAKIDLLACEDTGYRFYPIEWFYNELPEEIFDRTKIWTNWLDNSVKKADEWSKEDINSYVSYGRTLAYDLKRLFPKLNVFFGHRTDNNIIDIKLTVGNCGDRDITCLEKRSKQLIKFKEIWREALGEEEFNKLSEETIEQNFELWADKFN